MRRRAFPGYGPEVESRYERAGKWLLATIYGNKSAEAWCKANGVPIRKAAGESIGSTGGYVVPTELSKAILDLRDAFGAFRRRARIIPMASDNTIVPRHANNAAGTTGTASTAAYFIGENSAATETNARIEALSLTAKKIGSLVRISNELEEDAIEDIVDYIANEIGVAFAAQEDDCAFNGDGTSVFGTMVGVGQIVLDGAHTKAKVTALHNTFGSLDATDLSSLISAVRAAAVPNAAWFCSQTCFAITMCRLVGTGGAYMDNRIVDGVNTPYYLGFPVVLTQKLPLLTSSLSGKVMLAFGDMYLAGALGQRRGITLARSSDRYMDQDEIAVLGTERFHTVIHDIGDNTNAGAIAALVGS